MKSSHGSTAPFGQSSFPNDHIIETSSAITLIRSMLFRVMCPPNTKDPTIRRQVLLPHASEMWTMVNAPKTLHPFICFSSWHFRLVVMSMKNQWTQHLWMYLYQSILWNCNWQQGILFYKMIQLQRVLLHTKHTDLSKDEGVSGARKGRVFTTSSVEKVGSRPWGFKWRHAARERHFCFPSQ